MVHRKRNLLMYMLIHQCFFGPIIAKEYNHKQKKLVCITIPKTGTHLLEKCISLFNVPGINYEFDKLEVSTFVKDINSSLPDHIKSKVENPTGKRALHFHWIYKPETEQFLKGKTFANFFTIRDPRDQMVSLAFACKKKRYKNTPVASLLLDFIYARKTNFIPRSHQPWPLPEHQIWSFFDLPWFVGIVEYYRLFLPWMHAAKFYTVRFENLVGPNGGGTLEAQLQEIKNIAKHMGLEIDDARAKQIGEDLFGGTLTFRSGQIGTWKKYFTPEIKQAFKSIPGANELLIELGYEKDANW